MERSENQAIGPDEQHDIIHKMCLLLVESSPDSWHEIQFLRSAVYGYAMSQMVVTFENGETERKRFHRDVNTSSDKLRSGMYKKDQGTWFSMKIVISRPGKFRSEFNYDERPDFMLWPSPQNFAEDLEEFPRSPEHIPDWLREELRKAEQD